MTVKLKKRSFAATAMLAVWAISLGGCDCCPLVSPGQSAIKAPAYRTVKVGESVSARPIRMHVFGDSGPTTLVISALHGDEGITEFVCLHLI